MKNKIGKIKSENGCVKYAIESSIELGAEKEEFEKTFKNIQVEDGFLNVKTGDNTVVSAKVVIFNGITKEVESVIDYFLTENIDYFFKNKSLFSLLYELNFAFGKKQHDELIEAKLIGDLGEIIFLTLLEKNNINWENSYQKSDNSLFDFCFDNVYIEVKTTTKLKQKIIINSRQLFNNDEVFFKVFILEKKQGLKNIFDLLSNLKYTNKIIEEKKEFWRINKSKSWNIISSWTVDTDNLYHFFIDKNDVVNNFKFKDDMFYKFEIPINTKNVNKKNNEEVNRKINHNDK